MSDEFWTVANPAQNEIRIERSRFIGHCATAASESEARDFISDIRQQYADATHNCYAYRVGSGSEPLTYYHDHGEPTGTAGKPILNAILQAGLHQTVVVVTRYFGGKKLGVRGLIDAYHQAAADVLSFAGRSLWIEGIYCDLTLPYSQWSLVQREIGNVLGRVEDTDYAERIMCHLWLPRKHWNAFRESIGMLDSVTLEESLKKADGLGASAQIKE